MSSVALRTVRLTNLLSFGPDTEETRLGPLNVLIGPNGSGKSNLIEALSQRAESDEDQYTGDVHDDDTPCCPHCGSARTRLLAEWPRFSVP